MLDEFFREEIGCCRVIILLRSTMNFPLLFQSYWRDEAFSILLAQKSVPDIIRIVAHDFSPPLYFLLLRIWIIFFGTSEVATRSLSFLFYVLTLITIFFMVRHFMRLNKWLILLIVIVLGCIHPLMINNAFETRMYTMIAWLTTLSWYLLLRKKWRMYALVTLAGLYTQYFMVIIVGVQLLYILLRLLIQKKNILYVIQKNLLPFAFLMSPLFFFMPWILYVLASHNLASSQSFWIPKPTILNLITIPSFITFGYDTFSNFKFDVKPFSFLIYALVTLSFLQRPKDKSHVVYPLILWTFVPGILVWILAQFTTSLFLPRYLIVSSPALIMLVIVCLHELKPISKVVIASLILIVLSNFLTTSARFSQTHQLFGPTKESLRSKIEIIKDRAQQSDYLIVESELDYHVAQVYWFDPEHVMIIGKTYQEIPDYVGKSLIPESAILTKPYPNIKGHILRKDRKVTIFE
jgi:uncharacterized membrane protein